MKIAFRVDSSIKIGSGHVMRCLTLANALPEENINVVFISRVLPGNYISKLEASNYKVHKLSSSDGFLDSLSANKAGSDVFMEQDASETLEKLDGHFYDWLVVDHYSLDYRWEKKLKNAVKKIFVIDDLANRRHDCDVLLDQNYFGVSGFSRYMTLVPETCCCLLGTRFALLQSEYSLLKKKLEPHEGIVRRILVFFGGSDSENLTGKVLVALARSGLDDLFVDVVLGANHPDPDMIHSLVKTHPQIMLYRNLSSLAHLMIKADLFVGAGGSTTWERLALELPSIVTSVAENQRVFTELLAEEGVQLLLADGEKSSPNDWYESIIDLIKQPELVKKLARKAGKVVDGLGVERIKRLLLTESKDTISCKPATEDDDFLLWEWANDKEVRHQSFQEKLIGRNEHETWFLKKQEDPHSFILIGKDEVGVPVGQVRLDLNKEQSEVLISISLDVVCRGQGLAKKLLAQAIEWFRQKEKRITFIAEVKNDNCRSKRVFEQLGFVEISSRRTNAMAFSLD